MAVFQTIRDFFIPISYAEVGDVVPAEPTVYSVHPLSRDHIQDAMRLNYRCFKNGENYTRTTFNYLFDTPRTLSYRADTAAGEMAAFIFAMITDDGAAHITTVGVAPEHRRRGLATTLLTHLEERLRAKKVSTVILEVRVSNTAAQALYRESGYNTVQRVGNYYNNGEDGYLMVKSLV